MSTNETSNLQKNELLSKLEKISQLYDKTLFIQNKMDEFVPEDHYERKIILPPFPGKYRNEEERSIWQDTIDHSEDDALATVSTAYDMVNKPKQPTEPKIEEFEYETDSKTKQKMNNLKLYSNISAGVGIFFFSSIIIGSADDAWFTILVISLICAFLFVFFRNKLKGEVAEDEKKKSIAFAEYNQQNEEASTQYKEDLKKYESECIAYEKRRQEFLSEYVDWREIYIQSAKEEYEIEEKLEEDRMVAVNKIKAEEFVPVLRELTEINDIISNDYLPAIDDIIDLIKTGRADSVKEAINLYEEIVYRERQLELQREQEEQRQYEEELRRQDEERRYQEEKAFREEQEYQRQREAKAQLDFQKQQAEDERRFREQQENNRKREEEYERRKRDKEELDRKRREDSDTMRQCNTCALVGHCSIAFTRPNCASFRPR